MDDEVVDPIAVQIVRRKSDLHLVQWDDGKTYRRAWLTPSVIVEKVDEKTLLVMESDLEEAVPYGEMWDLLFDIPTNITSEQVDRELKRKDIWTIEDLQMKPDVARLAMTKLYRLDIVSALNIAARRQQSIGGNP